MINKIKVGEEIHPISDQELRDRVGSYKEVNINLSNYFTFRRLSNNSTFNPYYSAGRLTLTNSNIVVGTFDLTTSYSVVDFKLIQKGTAPIVLIPFSLLAYVMDSYTPVSSNVRTHAWYNGTADEWCIKTDYTPTNADYLDYTIKFAAFVRDLSTLGGYTLKLT